MKRTTSLVLGCLLLTACSAAPDQGPLEDTNQNSVNENGAGAPTGKADAWDSRNDPHRLSNENFEYNISALPTSGFMDHLPVPGDYWATYRDSINADWNSSGRSPSVKYAKAVGYNPDSFRRAVSESVGLLAASHPACDPSQGDSGCRGGDVCAPVPHDFRDEAGAEGLCVPSWTGICHGWSPYALMEPLAKKAVTYNGVTFLPGDLNALLSLVYTEVPQRGIAGRCNGDDSKGGVAYDDMGRAIESRCRDVNPGSLYVIAANMLGLHHRGFVVDRTMDAQVWNQPVRGYRITKLDEISSQRAQELVSDRAATAGLNEILVQDTTYSGSAWNPSKASGSFTAPGGKISLVAQGTGNIGVWLFTGPNFNDTPEQSRCYTGRGEPSSLSCQLRAMQGEQVHWVLKSYGYSRVTLGYGTEASGNTRYQFNDNAVRFFDVSMELHWIREASPSSEIWNPESFVDNHTRIDHYTFVLEVDAQDNIIGGEYTGNSKRFHADFLWYPTARPSDLRLSWRYKLNYDLLRKINAAAAN